MVVGVWAGLGAWGEVVVVVGGVGMEGGAQSQ